MKLQKLKLKKLINTRDLGGLPTSDGHSIKYGKLIRSGKLYKLPDKTKESLQRIGVDKIIDLRIDAECNDNPADIPAGCEYIRLPLLCTATVGITRNKGMGKVLKEESAKIKAEYGSVDNYMISMYQKILFLPESKENLKKFLRLVVDNEGCILWNCSGGKDRTGICAMLIEELLGVNEDLIIVDYTASYKFQRKKRIWQKFGLYIVPVSRAFRAILIAMMNANQKYIKAAINAIKALYGSVVEYCKQELDITDEDVATLKEKYLEK